jgi:hypothetical protein
MKTMYRLDSSTLREETIIIKGKPRVYNIGILKVKPATPKNGKWTDVIVHISPLTMTCIANVDQPKKSLLDYKLEPGVSFTDTTFSSEVNSQEYKENPFKLIAFKRGNKVNHKLEIVYETKGEVNEVKDFFQRVTKVNRYRYIARKYWTRWVEVTDCKPLKECDPYMRKLIALTTSK